MTKKEITPTKAKKQIAEIQKEITLLVEEREALKEVKNLAILKELIQNLEIDKYATYITDPYLNSFFYYVTLPEMIRVRMLANSKPVSFNGSGKPVRILIEQTVTTYPPTGQLKKMGQITFEFQTSHDLVFFIREHPQIVSPEVSMKIHDTCHFLSNLKPCEEL